MKVVDWDKWQRTKMVLVFVFWFGAIGFMGGLESQESDPPPNWIGVLICLTVAGCLLWNVIQIDRQRGKW